MNDEAGLMRINAITIPKANVRNIVHGFRVLKRVNKIRDSPVARVDLGASVEKDSVAVCEGGSGVITDVAHIGYLIWGCGCFVEEDATYVDILLCGATPLGPVLVGGDLGFQGGQGLRRRADVVSG